MSLETCSALFPTIPVFPSSCPPAASCLGVPLSLQWESSDPLEFHEERMAMLLAQLEEG